MKILVYGFFNKSNIGDNLFIEAYKKLFPEYEFTFSEKITAELFESHDTLFLGGGSFLDGQLNVPKELLEKLPSKPIVYLGVGAETSIHPWHKFLIQKASLVCIRSIHAIDKIKALNANTIYCPDLVYALSDEIDKQKAKPKSILFLPNSHTVSKWNDAAWKHSAWEYFKSECAQTFEFLIDHKHSIDVLPMCRNSNHKDDFTAAEIANKMTHGKLNILPFEEYDFVSLSKLCSSYELIISQRYHGLVMADITQTPCINLHHHDKLKYFNATLTKNVDFYRTSKSAILTTIDDVLFVKSLHDKTTDMAINLDAFTDLKDKVKTIIFKE